MASLPPTTAAAASVASCYYSLLNLTFLYYFPCKTIFKKVAVVVTHSSYEKHPAVVITISDSSRIKVQITHF